MTKAVILVSGGLDSTVLLASSVKDLGKEHVVALNIYYGQKHKKEAECAEYQTNKYGVELISMDLAPMFKFDSNCTLLEGNDEIPTGDYKEQLGEGKIVSTYVPYRNGLFLSVAAAVAIQLGAKFIGYGAHLDDGDGAAAYPDCSEHFVASIAESIYVGSGEQVTLVAPFAQLTKAGIVKLGNELEVEFAHTWSCYEGKDTPCGTCATCIDRASAFAENNLTE